MVRLHAVVSVKAFILTERRGGLVWLFDGRSPKEGCYSRRRGCG